MAMIGILEISWLSFFTCTYLFLSIDVDECGLETKPCHQNAICKNLRGSHNCTCNEGYFGNGVNCTDIDECNNNSSLCDDLVTCTNTNGSYNCGDCPSGYSGNSTHCIGSSIFLFNLFLYIIQP